MIMFSVVGAVFGINKETIASIVILVPLAISTGCDSNIGVAIVFVAFQFGDSFTNMITPTSGVLIGVLCVAKFLTING